MTTPDDNHLLHALRGGDSAAFQLLYRRHQAGLYRFALLLCGAPELAADVVQEVFMGLLNDSYRYDPLRGMLGHFLFGVARKLALKQVYERGRWSPLPEQLEDGGEDVAEAPEQGGVADEPLARLLDHEAAESLRAALLRLAPHHRDVLILYEMHDLSYAEIGAICQLDLGTVRSRLSRARASLARRLASAAVAGNSST